MILLAHLVAAAVMQHNSSNAQRPISFVPTVSPLPQPNYADLRKTEELGCRDGDASLC